MKRFGKSRVGYMWHILGMFDRALCNTPLKIFNYMEAEKYPHMVCNNCARIAKIPRYNFPYGLDGEGI